MNFENGLKFLRLLPTGPDHALTVSEILEKWMQAGTSHFWLPCYLL